MLPGKVFIYVIYVSMVGEMNHEIFQEIITILKKFPIKSGKKLIPSSKLSDIIDVFSSLLSERVKSKFSEFYPDINFSDLDSSSTIKNIYEKIKLSDNLDLLSKQKLKSNNEEFLEINKIIPEKKNINIVGIGIDVESLDNFPIEILSFNESQLRHDLFSAREILYALTKLEPDLTLLGMFCAKESVKKAANLKNELKFHAIEILHNSLGQPYVSCNLITGLKFFISISHSKKIAVANCIAYYT